MNKLTVVDIGDTFFSNPGQAGGRTHFLTQLTDVSSLITFVINLSFVIAGLFVLFTALIGGFQIISGAGSGSPESAAKGKKAVTSAILGFIIIFVAFWVIRFLEIITGVDFVTNPQF